MIIVDKEISKKINSIYKLNIDGNVQNKDFIESLHFEFPRVDFLEEIFMNFFENINSKYMFITKGYNVMEDENFLRFTKEDFIEFIKTNKTYTSPNGFKHNIETYYLIGITIFDESLSWLIHKNPDEVDITFSYQSKVFLNLSEIKKLQDNEWIC